MKPRRVVATGLGVITAIGQDVPSFWKSLLADAHLKKAALVTVEADIRDDIVTEIGRCDLAIQPAGGPETAMTIKYIVVWKEEGGAWKWHWDIWIAVS